MHLTGQIQHLVDGFVPIYQMLFFAWPPFLVFLLRRQQRLMARLITLWTISGVLSVFMVMVNLSTISLLPSFGPEPYNTIVIVSLRLALLVLLASLLVRPKTVLVSNR